MDKIKEIFTTNEFISNIYSTLNIDKTLASIIRVERFKCNPTKEDKEIGYDALVTEMDEELEKTAKKIYRIEREYYKETGEQLIPPYLDEKGKIMTTKEMTREQKINLILNFRKLDLLNDEAVREFLEE